MSVNPKPTGPSIPIIFDSRYSDGSITSNSSNLSIQTPISPIMVQEGIKLVDGKHDKLFNNVEELKMALEENIRNLEGKETLEKEEAEERRGTEKETRKRL